MVTTTDVAQLTRECNAWRETLRSYRDDFGQLKHRLQGLAARQTHKDVLLEIEHLDNQFHIQLINIHDLKKAIKTHQHRIDTEMARNATLTDETATDHEILFDDYSRLENTLQQIIHEFEDFSNHLR